MVTDPVEAMNLIGNGYTLYVPFDGPLQLLADRRFLTGKPDLECEFDEFEILGRMASTCGGYRELEQNDSPGRIGWETAVGTSRAPGRYFKFLM